MGDVGDEAGRAATAELESLHSALSRRGFRVTLGPDRNEEPCLEVMRPGLDGIGAVVSGGRVYWHDGAFWWSHMAEPERLEGTGRAVERITATLSRRFPHLAGET
jgi:hypothetical protein